jgi:hypothetical protein
MYEWRNIMINLETLTENRVSSQIILENNEKVLNLKRTEVIDEKDIHLTDEPTFSYIKDFDFHDGIIEVKVKSRFLDNAPKSARGFIGVAFRINSDLTQYESIYIRPDNGSCDDQIRRNHSTQYYSYPNHKWFQLRQNEPKKYESYVDIAMNEWTDFKIVIEGSRCELFINQAKNPCLIVTDLKLGDTSRGSIGLWTEMGTDAYFKDFKVTNVD